MRKRFFDGWFFFRRILVLPVLIVFFFVLLVSGGYTDTGVSEGIETAKPPAAADTETPVDTSSEDPPITVRDEVEYFTPMAEIADIVEKSGRYDYHTTFLDPGKALEEYRSSLRQNSVDQVVAEVEGKRKVFVYQISEATALFLRQASEFRKEQKFSQVEETLRMAVREDPDYFGTYLHLGRLYLDQHRFSDALLEFNRALDRNPACFQAYKYKAAAYMAMGDNLRCLDSLIEGLTYNRNDEEIMGMLRQLGPKMGFRIYSEPFLPLYSLQKMDNKKLRIYIDHDQVYRWMPYGFCKAIWQYEPGYFEKRTGEKEYRRTVLEEMECIHNILWSFNAFKIHRKITNDPVLDRLEDIRNRFFLKEFVLFEIISPQEPEVLVLLDESHRADIRDYIREFILVKDPESLKKVKPGARETFPVR